MNLRFINPRLNEIKIGTVTRDRDVCAFCTVCNALCGSFAAITLPSDQFAMFTAIAGVASLNIGLYGLQWELEQKKINLLKAEQQELQNKKAIQKRLIR